MVAVAVVDVIIVTNFVVREDATAVMFTVKALVAVGDIIEVDVSSFVAIAFIALL